MLIVACSIGLGLGISISPNLLSQAPSLVKNIFGSGIVTGSIVAVVLNAFLNFGDKDNHSDIKSAESHGSGMII
jgi:xanthine permease